MFFINALELINLAIKHNILTEQDGGVFVYRTFEDVDKDGWYLIDKNELAQELMTDEEGQQAIISELKIKHINFVPTDYVQRITQTLNNIGHFEK